MSELADSIRRLTSRREAAAHVAKVISVDRRTRSCEVEPLGDYAPLPDTRLQASLEGSAGVVLIPKVGSVVVVLLLSDSHAAVVLAEEVESIEWTVGGQTLEYTKRGLKVASAQSNLAADLVAMLDELATALGDIAIMQVITPVGPGTVSPDTILKLQATKLKLITTIKPALKSYLHGA